LHQWRHRNLWNFLSGERHRTLPGEIVSVIIIIAIIILYFLYHISNY
jgi:hypothetical protein